MLLARVEGNVVATRKHPSFEGWRLVICQPIDQERATRKACRKWPSMRIGAGLHQRVVISSDGAAARKAVGDDKSPVRWMIIGIVDEKESRMRLGTVIGRVTLSATVPALVGRALADHLARSRANIFNMARRPRADLSTDPTPGRL